MVHHVGAGVYFKEFLDVQCLFYPIIKINNNKKEEALIKNVVQYLKHIKFKTTFL